MKKVIELVSNFISIFKEPIKLLKTQLLNFISLKSPSIIKKIISLIYLENTTKLHFDSSCLPDEWNGYATNLLTAGFVVIPSSLTGFENVCFSLFNKLSETSLHEFTRKDQVIDFQLPLSFFSTDLLKVYSDIRLCSFLHWFFGRQFYYREHPVILSHSSSSVGRSSENPHVDGYHQITMFLMLSEMNQNTSQLYVEPAAFGYPGLNLDRTKSSSYSSRMLPVNASVGDLVILNSGSTLHKGISRDIPRLIVNMVVTTGWLHTPHSSCYESDYLRAELRESRPIVFNAFSNMIVPLS